MARGTHSGRRLTTDHGGSQPFVRRPRDQAARTESIGPGTSSKRILLLGKWDPSALSTPVRSVVRPVGSGGYLFSHRFHRPNSGLLRADGGRSMVVRTWPAVGRARYRPAMDRWKPGPRLVSVAQRSNKKPSHTRRVHTDSSHPGVRLLFEKAEASPEIQRGLFGELPATTAVHRLACLRSRRRGSHSALEPHPIHFK